MKLFKTTFSFLLAAFALTACQSLPLTESKQATNNTPNSVNQQESLNQSYVWGGEIVSINNLADSTEITVISYPLNLWKKPKYKHTSEGRFIAVYSGFLEPTDYRPGQLITVEGVLTKFEQRKIEQANYNFPVIRTEKLKHHGNVSRNQRSIPFSVGIGIGFYN